jgi:hypothetical protein
MEGTYLESQEQSNRNSASYRDSKEPKAAEMNGK